MMKNLFSYRNIVTFFAVLACLILISAILLQNPVSHSMFSQNTFNMASMWF